MSTRKVIVFFAALATCTPVFSQGGTCTATIPWGVSGAAGDLYSGPGNSDTWRRAIQLAQDTYGGSPSCSYTFILDNPDTGYGHYYGYCYVTGYVCTGAPPPPPPAGSNESDPGPSCPSCGSPISLTNGNTYIEQTDVRLPGLGGGLSLTRTWNSIWPATQTLMVVGLFGNNWKSTYEERVFVGTDGTVKYARSTGQFWSFQNYGPNSGALAYRSISPANVHATMTNTSSLWTLKFSSGEKRTFDFTTGRLTAIYDRNGNATQLTYDSSNRLVTVTDTPSRHLYFGYAGPNSYLVTGVTSDTGLSWSYAYDSQSRLSQITKPDQTTLNFVYNAQSLITTVTDSQGKVLESHTYDNLARGLTSSLANGVEAVTLTYPQ